jgi:hypothetical protein
MIRLFSPKPRPRHAKQGPSPTVPAGPAFPPPAGELDDLDRAVADAFAVLAPFDVPPLSVSQTAALRFRMSVEARAAWAPGGAL